MPLLDGLDELGMERQRQCIAALNTFAQHYPRVVVCCREQEYREAGASLDALPGQVCLEPLTDQQIEQYLHDLGLDALWHDIQTSAAMRPMLEPDDDGNPGILRVPLLLSMAALSYEGQPFTNRAELYEAYVEQRLHYDTRKADRDWRSNQGREWAYPTPTQEPDHRQTLRTLRWMARQLQEDNAVELLIERIQPDWLEKPQARRRYRLIGGLIGGLIFGLISGLIFGLIRGLILGLILEPISRLILGLIRITPVEAFKISTSREAGREILKILKVWLIGGLILGLIFGLIGGLILGLIFGLMSGLMIELMSGLMIGLMIGLMSGLMIGLMIGLMSGLMQDLQLRSRPNQGIWNSLQSMLWTTAFSYPCGIILIFGITELPRIVAEGVRQRESVGTILDALWAAFPPFFITGIFGALLLGFLGGGGFACVQHVCLRFVLWQSGIAPWNLARFLNYCVERRLLQRVGGRYRFLHRELLDHFAGQNPL